MIVDVTDSDIENGQFLNDDVTSIVEKMKKGELIEPFKFIIRTII